jgi:hypothetical protein
MNNYYNFIDEIKILDLCSSLFNTKSVLEYEVKQAIVPRIGVVMTQVRTSVARGVK